MGTISDSNATNDNDETIVEISGATDSTPIGNVGDRLKVESTSDLSSDLAISQEFDQDQILDDVTYFDIINLTGVRTVSGFMVQFNDKKTFTRLEIDGVEIFDINNQEFEMISDWNDGPQPPLYISWNSNKKTFYFTPNFPIKSTTSVKIQARSAAGQSKKYLGSIIQVS